MCFKKLWKIYVDKFLLNNFNWGLSCKNSWIHEHDCFEALNVSDLILSSYEARLYLKILRVYMLGSKKYIVLIIVIVIHIVNMYKVRPLIINNMAQTNNITINHYFNILLNKKELYC